MAHNSDYSHIYTTSTEGLSFPEIARCLGMTLQGIGKLASSPNVNRWSKHKPFLHPNGAFGSDAARLAALRSCNCGFTMTKYSTPSACLNAAISLGMGGVAWTYVRPTGTIGVSPFRTLDFNDYWSTMQPPFSIQIVPNVCYQLSVPHVEDASASVSNIALEDMLGTPNLSAYKLGVAFRQHGTTGVARVQTINSAQQTIDVSSFVAGQNYDVCAILSPYSLNVGDSERTGDYYLAPIPLSSFQLSAQTGVYVNGQFNEGLLSLSLSISTMSGFAGYHAQKLQLVTTNPTSTVDLFGGAAQDISSTPITTSRANLSGWTGTTTFYLRIFRTTTTYVDQLFVPEIPIQ